jgi:hypothetical protein
MAEPIKIDHDIPYHGKSRHGRRSAYPFAELKVGDSFFVKSRKPFISQDRPLYAAYRHAQEHLGIKLAWARERDGYRIHRLG